ncbi:hypothetical protein F2P79_001151 [Pimephales promelas]|nr:hypothetical protein F2P79_010712 [Pimephales promelas]KAG1962843.1 hypothetical protein F2P79_004837 [Pimephales promelas]KAG1973998.1 hypothetical protein F2P79_001151 [Pimephales promelas]
MRVWTSLTAHFGSETRRIGGLLRGCFLSCLRSRRNSGESIMGQRFMPFLDKLSQTQSLEMGISYPQPHSLL